ncbi:MAG TPA: NUDIX hydrolase [Candidatus Saccharimonadales bacterium]|nr:NUDIX hydrolase [Candidatus Saccharimonadales bacterium]
MPQPNLTTSFTYRDKLIQVRWFDLVGKPLPDLPWQQVYVIGDLEGKAPIVHYATGDKDNLPGGKTEPGETVDQTIQREIEEELRCKVVSWYPIGYQENHEPDGTIIYQLRVRAILERSGIFEQDPAGTVVGHSLVDLQDLNTHIGYGDIGERMIALIEGHEKADSTGTPESH